MKTAPLPNQIKSLEDSLHSGTGQELKGEVDLEVREKKCKHNDLLWIKYFHCTYLSNKKIFVNRFLSMTKTTKMEVTIAAAGDIYVQK